MEVYLILSYNSCMRKHVSNKYLHLAKIFAKNGFTLYMVGGSARDYILGRDTTDLDLASDALVEQAIEFLSSEFQISTPFQRMGNLKMKLDDVRVDITTLRKEGDYSDSRHPRTIEFIKDIEIDSNRRDFTINSLYLDKGLDTIFDFHGGIDDLVGNRIRMIGDPLIRLAEDPLRILRALRFAVKLNFTIDDTLDNAIRKSVCLLEKLNPSKVEEELRKLFAINEVRAHQILTDYKLLSFSDYINEK